MVVRLECGGSLLRSSRECWSRWRSQTPWIVGKTDCVFPFHSTRATRTAITLTGWLYLKWQVWADVSLHPCPISGFWCMVTQAIGKKKWTTHSKTQRNSALLQGRAFLLPSLPTPSPDAPAPTHGFCSNSFFCLFLSPLVLSLVWSGLDGQGPC